VNSAPAAASAAAVINTLFADRGAQMRTRTNRWGGKAFPYLSPLFLAVAMLGTAGCSDIGLRRGISPVLDANAVVAATSNQTTIINALIADAGQDPSQPDFYKVAQAGFNYIDDQCNAYFDEMFFLDRGRSQVKSGLAAAGATTAAVLGLTNASTMSLSIVAAAFGFASNATDILAGTYLYALPPATTQGFVNRLQNAMRDSAAANAANINSRPAAYFAIQRYLSLCLPPTIEEEITRQIVSSTAVGVTAGRGSLVSVETGSSLPARPAIPRSRAVFIAPVPSPQQRATAPPPVTVLNPGGVSQYEKLRLPKQTILDYQKGLCVDPDGNVVSLRSAMEDFFRQADDSERADRIKDKGVLQGDLDELDKLLVNKHCGLK
jgi:hypothetical protein